MTRLVTIAVFTLALTLGAPVVPAAACTTHVGYRIPTNFELVERADTILLGVIEDGPLPRSGDQRPVVVRPTLLLKGPSLPSRVEIAGMLAGSFPIGLSDPADLENAHPNTYAGACARSMFVQGSTVLLFFVRQNGELRQYSPPFARAAEDVPGPDSRWVRAVRLYAAIAALPPADRRAALIVRRDELAARSDEPDALAIAVDIERHLRATEPPPCTLAYPVARDEAAARRIAEAVIASRPHPPRQPYALIVQPDEDDPGQWAAFETVPPTQGRGDEVVGHRGGGGVSMRIDRCTGAISRLHYSR